MINIRLYNKVPIADGYYLMRFTKIGGFHLVIIKTDLGGRRVFQTDMGGEFAFSDTQWFSDKLNITDGV